MSNQKVRQKLRRAGEKTQKGLGKAVKCVVYLCLTPCVCGCLLFLLFNNCLHPKPRRRSGRVHRPPVVPFPRRRRLTISNDDAVQGEWQEEQQTFPQQQSPLLHKLPLEIRRMIYQKVVGDQLLHISNHDNIHAYYTCDCPYGCCSVRPHPDQKLDLALDLLQTCRQIYSEAVELLYSGNRLSFAVSPFYHYSLASLNYALLPQRIAQIRDVFFYWDLSESPNGSLGYNDHDIELDRWNAIWGGLARMTGLRRLRIRMVLHQGFLPDHLRLWRNEEFDRFAIVKQITAPRDFVVEVPYPQFADLFDASGTNCVVKLTSDDTSDS